MTVADDRIAIELELLRGRWPSMEWADAERWVRIPRYPVPAEPPAWNRRETDVAFQILNAHPGKPPYGLYVPVGIRFNGNLPANYQEPAANRPPFAGEWGVFSWTVEDWRPHSDVRAGSNLVNWVAGFTHRFREGA